MPLQVGWHLSWDRYVLDKPWYPKIYLDAVGLPPPHPFTGWLKSILRYIFTWQALSPKIYSSSISHRKFACPPRRSRGQALILFPKCLDPNSHSLGWGWRAVQNQEVRNIDWRINALPLLSYFIGSRLKRAPQVGLTASNQVVLCCDAQSQL